MINRRGFVRGLLALPAIVRTPGLLMPVHSIKTRASGKYYFEIQAGRSPFETAQSVSSCWLTKTPDEVLDDVNKIFSIGWDQCQPADVTGINWQVVFDDGNLQLKPMGFRSF